MSSLTAGLACTGRQAGCSAWRARRRGPLAVEQRAGSGCRPVGRMACQRATQDSGCAPVHVCEAVDKLAAEGALQAGIRLHRASRTCNVCEGRYMDGVQEGRPKQSPGTWAARRQAGRQAGRRRRHPSFKPKEQASRGLPGMPPHPQDVGVAHAVHTSQAAAQGCRGLAPLRRTRSGLPNTQQRQLICR